MEKESEPRLYETAYMLKAADEASALERAAEISGAVEKEHGIIATQIQPSLKALSYPLGKETEAWWGLVKFMLKPEGLDAINKKMTQNSNVLRFTVVKIKKEEMSERMPRKRRIVSRPMSPEKKASVEEIDKKLEEMLGE